MNQRLEDAQNEEDGSTSTSETSSSESGGSSSSAMGLRKADGAKKAKAKAKRKAKAAKPSVLGDEPAEPKAEKADAKVATPALVDKARAAIKSLSELNSWSLWSGAFKPKDVDGRIAKGVDFAAKLDGRPDAAEVHNELNTLVNQVSMHVQLFNGISTSKSEGGGPEGILRESAAEVLEIVSGWTTDQQISFLTDVGKKLIEAWVSTEGENSFIFRFIQVDTKNEGVFGFAMLVAACEKDKDGPSEAVQNAITSAQHTLLNHLMDRFRATTCTEKLLVSLPKEWFVPAVLRPGSKYLLLRRHSIA